MRVRASRNSEEGFTLLEAMASVAALGAMMLAMGLITGQWLPHWSRGFGELQNADRLSLALERIVADISAAKYVSLGGASNDPLFAGDDRVVTFIRTALGPDAPLRLEIVRIATSSENGVYQVVRTRAPFTPVGPSGALPKFSDPVVLLHAPFRLTFAYAGRDRLWRDRWTGGKLLPAAVSINVRDDQQGVLLAASTTAELKITAPAELGAGKDNTQEAKASPIKVH